MYGINFVFPNECAICFEKICLFWKLRVNENSNFFIFVTNTEPDDPFTSKHIHNVENDEDTTTTTVTL